MGRLEGTTGQAAGTVAERTGGPWHSLLRKSRGRRRGTWRRAATEVAHVPSAQIDPALAEHARLRRVAHQIRLRDEALLRHSYAHRFLVARLEVCAAKRMAELARLTAEQDAEITTLRRKAAAETRATETRATLPAGRAFAIKHRQEQRRATTGSAHDGCGGSTAVGSSHTGPAPPSRRTSPFTFPVRPRPARGRGRRVQPPAGDGMD